MWLLFHSSLADPPQTQKRLCMRLEPRRGMEGRVRMRYPIPWFVYCPTHSSYLFADAAFARQSQRPSGTRLHRCNCNRAPRP